eukprot:CAMPEP_0184300680 /NCGR_PEP_ID=MMETSP1049-20130417/11057_1 /TAXON_ID=77928 /ORGANISM="Proteomonas sulcata, Strain CCMP704" /LENGTH=275 /DNA_ID=CAMNT_0026611475 /DNA_START=50 /DNA_END=877 /DNA_ORIENTATION=+
MSGYTNSLQESVAEDMKVLGKLRTAEESAAPGPHLISSVWEKPPTGDLPEINPEHFMGDAPLRDAASLTDPEYKQKKGTTMQLTQASPGSSIMRVMSEASQELKQLDSMAAKKPRFTASERAVHHKVDSNLAQLEVMARQAGIDDKGVDAAARFSGSSFTGSRFNAVRRHKEHFTSFPVDHARQVRKAHGDVSQLDDGAAISHANRPVGHIAIPLGAHQDASKGRVMAKAPKATIVDNSPEAMAVRADGSHNFSGKKVRDSLALELPDVHMPHVA